VFQANLRAIDMIGTLHACLPIKLQIADIMSICMQAGSCRWCRSDQELFGDLPAFGRQQARCEHLLFHHHICFFACSCESYHSPLQHGTSGDLAARTKDRLGTCSFENDCRCKLMGIICCACRPSSSLEVLTYIQLLSSASHACPSSVMLLVSLVEHA
jgi:hypothetical protein